MMKILFIAMLLLVPAYGHADTTKWERHSINGISFELPEPPEVATSKAGAAIWTVQRPEASYMIRTEAADIAPGGLHAAAAERSKWEGRNAKCPHQTAKRSMQKVGSFFVVDVFCKTTVGGPAAYRTMTNGKVMAVLVIMASDEALQRRFLASIQEVRQ